MKIKPFLFAGLLLLAVALVIGGIKFLQIRRMIEAGAQFVPPPETVSVFVAERQSWESILTATGSLRAVQGVTVAAELPGKVARIAFEAGTAARAGDLLLEQDTSSEKALLPGAQARADLAKSNLARSERLLAERVISPAEHDAVVAESRQALAEVEAIRSTIDKKTIRAPFAGRLGIRLVNLGQILREGEAIVSLQSLDPIHVDFLLPQQFAGLIRPGLPVRVRGDDPAGGAEQEGRVTALNPEVDAATRNLRVQATLENREERLRPGMFVQVRVILPEQEPVLAIPATAVLYAPYGNSVFVVEEKRDASGAPVGRILRQQVVRLGEQRGDFVAVSEGLEEGATLVSTGVFKLRNGQEVVVDNRLAPEFRLQPNPGNE
ncbi:efflux RND transporter periplasmic adaptor subunit [Geoalkalibacter sp.]|uniref:efflux RND transporter periplasmic adaptor subunit n=1 Tax=Geoalkalibacter sp. TaxID=3041440 RepID=UPI00272DF0A3|nr:efflux RND transporter periplasmic adaptor subunit [Geoalkalibacter sp.]